MPKDLRFASVSFVHNHFTQFQTQWLLDASRIFQVPSGHRSFTLLLSLPRVLWSHSCLLQVFVSVSPINKLNTVVTLGFCLHSLFPLHCSTFSLSYSSYHFVGYAMICIFLVCIISFWPIECQLHKSRVEQGSLSVLPMVAS